MNIYQKVVRWSSFLLVIGALLVQVQTAQAAGLDLNRYCRDAGYSYATLTQHNAFGWVCVASDGSHHGMDLNQACRQQYSSSWSARYRDANDPYSWECKKWCSVHPNASQFGWQGVNPNFALRIKGPGTLDWDPGRGEEYYIYYNGAYVGPDVVAPQRYVDGAMEWGVDTTWTGTHPLWLTDSNWTINYTLEDNTCPYTKY